MAGAPPPPPAPGVGVVTVKLPLEVLVFPAVSLTNTYIVELPDDAVSFSIVTPQAELIEGEPLDVDVSVVNNLNTVVIGELTLDLATPTVLGTLTSTETQTVDLQPGQNDFKYTIPLNISTASVTITPSLDIELKGANFDNLNFVRSTDLILPQLGGETHKNFAKVSIKPSDKIPIGTLEGNQILLQISPEEIVVGEIEVTVEEEEPVTITPRTIIDVEKPRSKLFSLSTAIVAILVIFIILITVFIIRRASVPFS